MVHMLHQQYLKTLKRWIAVPAPLECMAPAALADVFYFVEAHDAVLSTLCAALTGSPNHGAAVQSILGKVADMTYDAMLAADPEALRPCPYLRFFGIVTKGDLSMKLARKKWVAGRTTAASALLALA